ncbi:hypothetical protein GCM10027277_32350 [Pseudoduganella ginsengisoli]|uniref:Cupin fold metalloprotein, WbuC family n=1 Tax=Pseudoduganella ginsengisoli TaxID=1462440 RepID=A0A6L6PYY2_9BURK|nr:WbuC family cupin fold metalloprotein [Pseudoduganella ginsengisoli]MTW02645.1 cupin fold metalloprotein, WbuC family [Pseudoduganella ginsengisoli]
MQLIKQSNEVYVAPGPVAAIGAAEIALLKEAVDASPRGRVRINLHADGSAPLHEMFIAIKPGSYIRPHKHPAKSESFHLVHGAVDVVVFDDAGNVTQVVKLGQPDGGDGRRAFYYRMSEPLFHTLIIRSDVLIVHETTNGPFDRSATIFAGFAPEENAPAAEIASWQAALVDRVQEQA